jgi:hypothetical protein
VLVVLGEGSARAMELYGQLIMVGLVLGVLWLAFQPRYVFVVRIRNRLPRVAKGKVTPAFLQGVAEACGACGVRRGWVGGVGHGQRITLRFARGTPASFRQRVRNLWSLHS